MANPWDDDYSQPAPETVVESGPRIIGQSKKSIFGESQARAAGSRVVRKNEAKYKIQIV